MQVEQLFIRASEEFEDRNYQQGLKLISRCLQQDPNNSQLHSNRGLFYAQLGQNQSATQDLNRAIELNHLNYVAYFNLFSLQYRSGQEEEAFDNLCCSLSGLYLLRAKKSRRELDVQRAISYADNNFEAYVLKSLMYLQDGRLSQALNYMQWACDLNPGSGLSKKLKNIIARKIDPYATEDFVGKEIGGNIGGRLKGSYKVEQGSISEQVVGKVKQFIEVYNDLLGQEGTVTQKVPRILNEQDRTLMKSNVSELSGIYQFKMRSSKLVDAGYSRGKMSEAPTKQNLPGEDAREYNLLLQNQDQPSLDHILNPNKILSAREYQEQQNLLDGSLGIRQEVKKEEIMVIFDNDQENLLEDQPVKLQQPKVEQMQGNRTPRSNTVQNSKMSSNASSESTSLYPITSRKKIQFTVIGAEVKNPSTHKDFYLTGNYNSRKGQRLRTNIKKIQGNSILWYSSNPPTNISQNKQTLSVKLYSKQYFSINDQLIGEGEVEVLKSGDLKIPVYYRAKSTGVVTVKIDLI